MPRRKRPGGGGGPSPRRTSCGPLALKTKSEPAFLRAPGAGASLPLPLSCSPAASCRTAREHRPRGHFGLPENKVRASRWRPNAAERLRQERQVREARLRRGQAEHPPSQQAQAETPSADENAAPDRVRCLSEVFNPPCFGQ